MHHTDIFIRRPVFATVLSLIILLFGIRAFYALPLRQYPNIEPSVVEIQTTYTGANAQLMEGFITTPIENALGGISGLDYIQSQSSQDSSTIRLQFQLGYDVNQAITDVTNAVSSVRYSLPKAIDDPIISKNDPNARPTVYLSFQSPYLSAGAITDYILRVLQPQFEILPDVGEAQVLGARQYAMRLWLDPERMAAQNITPDDISNALANNNVQAAPGSIESPTQEISIEAQTDLQTVKDFNQLIIKNNGDSLQRIQDIGTAELGPENDQVSVNVNGNKNTVVMGILPQPTGNPLLVSYSVENLIKRLQPSLPKNFNIQVLWDTSKFIEASLSEVKHSIFEAILCVMLVIFLFLGSPRAVLIPLVTIPLSLIGVCGLMLALGYSLNTLTLLAWVLAIGLVVDDAIVVVENIHRHIDHGETPFDAAIFGMREIGFAIIAITLTLAAVYAPIGFMSDMTGRLFREFAFTLASAVIISGFIALTLSPMMCAKILKPSAQSSGFMQNIEHFLERLVLVYKRILEYVLQKKRFILLLGGVVYLICILLFWTLPHELAPSEDQGAIIGFMTGPTSANIYYTEQYTQQVEQIYKKVPEKAAYAIVNGFPNGQNSAISFLVLKPWSERSRTSDEIIQALLPEFWGVAGLQAFPVNLPALPGSSDLKAINFVLKTTGSYEDLNTAVQKMLQTIAEQNPKITNLETDLKLDKPETVIQIDRNKANSLGISMNDIASALNMLLAQPQASQFNMLGRSYDVIPELYPKDMYQAAQLNNINLRTAQGSLIPLSNLVRFSEHAAPQSLNHFQQTRSASILASLTPGYTLGQALDYLQNLAKQILPDTISIDFGGESRQFMQAGNAMKTTFIFALIFIFLILSAQFESFRYPIVVMVSVPLSLTGALLATHLTGGNLNIYTEIGLITLIGLITKHGILIVEFAQQLRSKGLAIQQAVVQAASLRLRPILMTTSAMICGALPLAFASGAGAEARRQLGNVIIGGMAFGTLLTLFIIPVVYVYLSQLRVKKHE